MLVMVADNAGNNGTLLQALITNYQDQLAPNFNSGTSWIHCFAHIVNLGAQAVIDVLKQDPGKEHSNVLAEQDFVDGRDISEEVLKSLSLYDQVSPFTFAFVALLSSNVNPFKIKRLVAFLNCSTKAQDVYKLACKEALEALQHGSLSEADKFKYLKLVNDICTQWNSTCIMLEHLLQQHLVSY